MSKLTICVSRQQYKKYLPKAIPIGPSCFAGGALLEMEGKDYSFSKIPPITSAQQEKWIAKVDLVLEAYREAYHEVLGVKFESADFRLLFRNWLVYLLFRYFGQVVEYEKLSNDYPNTKVAVPSIDLLNHPCTTTELRALVQSDLFNEHLLYFVTQHFGKFDVSLIKRLVPVVFIKRNMSEKIKGSLRKVIFRSLNNRILKLPTSIIIKRLLKKFEIYPNSKDVIDFSSGFHQSLRLNLMRSLDVKLSQLNIKDHHSIAGLSAFFTPTSLLECYPEIEKAMEKYGCDGSHITTRIAHYDNEFLKAYIIKWRKLGRRHVIHAHGGGYHMPKWTDARWERQVADEMKCFVEKVPSLSNGEFLQNFSKKLNLKRQSKARKKVLIVGTTANIHREGTFPYPDTWGRYSIHCYKISSLIEYLVSSNYEVHYRHHRHDYGWGVSNYLLQKNPQLIVQSQATVSFTEAVDRSDIIINTSDTTTILQTLHHEIPVFALLDRTFWDGGCEGNNYDHMRCNSIFFDCPRELVFFINNVFANGISDADIQCRSRAISRYYEAQASFQTI